MSIMFWLTLARGLFAIIIGILMLVQPVKNPTMVLNFMGMFWLASGIVSVRWSMIDYRHRRMALAAGAVAILTGSSVLARKYTLYVVKEYIFLIMLGAVVLLTGIFHLIGGYKTDAEQSQHQFWPGLFLGLFEIILGVLLVTSPLQRGPFVFYSACIWAFFSGILLIGDAFAVRRANLKLAQAATANS